MLETELRHSNCISIGQKSNDVRPIENMTILMNKGQNHGNANECDEQWPKRGTDFHFGATSKGEVGLL